MRRAQQGWKCIKWSFWVKVELRKDSVYFGKLGNFGGKSEGWCSNSSGGGIFVD